jgi:hypothetical protein
VSGFWKETIEQVRDVENIAQKSGIPLLLNISHLMSVAISVTKTLYDAG